MQIRFGALDALRGVAALAVVLFHLGEVKLIGDLVPRAYLAVDFFFVLSGFVIAYTYEAKLDAGMSVGAFLARRTIRLYPLTVLAVCLGGAVLLMKARVDPSRVDPLAQIVASVAGNLVLLPNIFGGKASLNVLFPGNGPLWSICLEVLVNIVWCVALARAGTRTLVIIVGVCFALVGWCVVDAGSANLGFDWQTLPGGLARVGYGFSLGLLLFRLRDRLIVGKRLSAKIVGVMLLVAAFLVPHMHGLDAAWDILCIGSVMPLVVLLGLNSTDHPRLDHLLGTVSYPLYVIHFPILLLASGLHQKLPQLSLGSLLAGTALVLATATLAAIKLYDEPIRRVLTDRWRAGAARRDAPDPSAAGIATGTAGT